MLFVLGIVTLSDRQLFFFFISVISKCLLNLQRKYHYLHDVSPNELKLVEQIFTAVTIL
jgi:hypothetical protein